MRMAVAASVVTILLTTPALAQQRRVAPTTRAESLYVSADPADHPVRDYAADMKAKARTDSIYVARSAGVISASSAAPPRMCGNSRSSSATSAASGVARM